jgi:hypothetical protein
VIAASHNHATRNLVACLLRKREFATALIIADQMATANPGDVTLQIFTTQVLGSTPGAGDETSRRIAAIRAAYKLTAAQEDSLRELEQFLSHSPATPQ